MRRGFDGLQTMFYERVRVGVRVSVISGSRGGGGVVPDIKDRTGGAGTGQSKARQGGTGWDGLVWT